MIKINLVPSKEKKRQQEYILMLVGAVIALFLAAVLFWFYMQRVETKRDLNVQIKKVDDESKSYQDKIAEVMTFQDTEAKLEATNKNIKDIQLAQKKVIYTLDQAAISLPNGVWLTMVSQGSDPSSFVIDGYSFSLPEVKSYYETLTKIPGLSKDATLELKNVTAAVGNNKQIVQFEIATKATDVEQ